MGLQSPGESEEDSLMDVAASVSPSLWCCIMLTRTGVPRLTDIRNARKPVTAQTSTPGPTQ